MFGSTRFQLLSPPLRFGNERGFMLTTELPLSNADANSPTAILPRGKMIEEKANSETIMKLGSGRAIGILTRDVSLNGTTDATGFQKLTLGGYPDIPVKRGQPVTIFMPLPGCECIFEGAIDISGGNGAAIDGPGLVIKTGTGAISAGTAVDTKLSVLNGSWRVAQTGDYCIALLKQANYTPVNAGEIRIRVQFVPPFVII